MTTDSQEPKILTLLEADLPKIVMSGFVSKRTTFHLRVVGPFGSKEINNLIRQLQLHLQFQLEDEGEQS